MIRFVANFVCVMYRYLASLLDPRRLDPPRHGVASMRRDRHNGARERGPNRVRHDPLRRVPGGRVQRAEWAGRLRRHPG